MEKRGYASIIVVLLFIVAAGAAALSWYKEKIAPNTETMSISEYYNIPSDKILFVNNGREEDEMLPYVDGKVYLRLDYVQQLNQRYYWDSSLEKLIYTTEDSILIIPANEKEYTIENGFIEEGEETDALPATADYIILREIDEIKYIAIDFVKDSINVEYEFYTDPNRLVIRSEWKEYLFVTVKKDTQLRAGGSVKSKVLRELPKGTKLELTDSAGSNRSGFVLATTEDGIKAYVDESFLEESNEEFVSSNFVEKEYSHISMDETICLGWHMVVSKAKNDDLTKLIKNAEDLNVISPTWFNLKDNEGNLDDRATKAYVDKAHQNGLQVWALFSNFSPVKTIKLDEMAILSSRETRAKIIDNLIKASKTYGFDGINVDFESISKDVGPHYVQLLRELSIACRHENLILSIDDYVPFNYNTYYNIAEQGRIADYVIIMAYDEHYDGSGAGSVSSLTYINTAIQNTCSKVAKEKVVIAIPFYTRLWKVTLLTDGKYRTYSDALSMTEAAKYVSQHRWIANWYEEEGQNFYTADEGNITYKLWMEDEKSIDKKLEAIFNSNTAGIACWRLGQESSEIWTVINKYFTK